ncbi:eukaryotic translation initiation factor 3 subunit D isoform X2 [Saccoglossus kowalevskii]|uniref:Eukaryotic translation initiation factor 3 subunit D n=1 Tax=Saccoglossus kowalevskii TaxID=10224 RepID=A0ABM0MVF5_SACKO|nr:PREDICTED: eukaryotic translation initiation factor 3 subunit D isoform X2 [Saccoglossus kowalevskii]
MEGHFIPPTIQDNPNGWGPREIPGQFKDMPYQPFSKGDRLGKVSDWTGATYQDKRYLIGKYSSQFGSGTQYAYYHEEDESSFQLVDTTKIQRPLYQRNRFRMNQRNIRRDRERREQRATASMQTLTKAQKERQRQLKRLQKQFGRQKWGDNRSQKGPQKNRDASVEVRHSWKVEEEMDFPRLSKLKFMDLKDPQDLTCAGAMEYYDKNYDRVTTKLDKRLKRVNRIFHKVTTTDDPIIRKLASKGNVFATDIILATLMCCTRSVYSWDVVVQHVGGKLFFDKRDDSEFDLLTVNETATEPPQDEGNHINAPRNLALEATFVNHNFSQQCLKMGPGNEKYRYGTPNPFSQDADDGEIASVGYRYRKWDLGDEIELIVRCEHDGVMIGSNGETQFVNIKTLNEWDSKASSAVDWRQKLDLQRGAILATELKNNSFKLAKWTTCALLAGSDQIKFGYVSRVNPKDSSKHVILGTQQFKPSEFASQINLNMDNAWGVLRCIIDICRKLPEGKFLIMKDPNKPVVRVYDIPDSTFETDEEDEDDDDDDEDDNDDNDDDD